METASAAPRHLADLTPCPFLPAAPEPLTAAHLAAAGMDRGGDFYMAALGYAQSLWLQGFPARALLLINRAMGCALEGTESLLTACPLPYRAAAWLLVHHRPGQFIGNPRRHWQHLATRMVEPRRELRTWRAWACWHMARAALPELPADEMQIARDGIREPDAAEIHYHLERLGHPGEVTHWHAALDICQFR